METITDLYIFIGSAGLTIAGIAIFGKDKGERALAQGRKEVQRGATNFARFQAQLATGSGAIRKGHE